MPLVQSPLRYHYFDNEEYIRFESKNCEEKNHFQQLVLSTSQNVLTQICFNCEVVRTTYKKPGTN